MKFSIHYNLDLCCIFTKFFVLFPFILVGKSKKVHCFLQSVRIEGKKRKAGRKGKRKESGWMSELVKIHFIFIILRCKLLGNFHSLVSKN